MAGNLDALYDPLSCRQGECENSAGSARGVLANRTTCHAFTSAHLRKARACDSDLDDLRTCVRPPLGERRAQCIKSALGVAPRIRLRCVSHQAGQAG